jgi:hypothetical protein
MSRAPVQTASIDSNRIDGVEMLACLIGAAGVVSMSTGVVAWLTIRAQLAGERIVIPGSAAWFPGRTVKGPLSAYGEASAIKRIALEATGGRTYGELDEADAAAEMAMHASLLRSSLFTSVLAFGVAATEVAFGGVLIVIGAALSRVTRQLQGGRYSLR